SFISSQDHDVEIRMRQKKLIEKRLDVAAPFEARSNAEAHVDDNRRMICLKRVSEMRGELIRALHASGDRVVLGEVAGELAGDDLRSRSKPVESRLAIDREAGSDASHVRS